MKQKPETTMPKILFIQPTQYGTDNKLCKQKKIYLPGLVFPLLAAMTPSEWDVEIKIEVVDDINFESDADIVGIGTMGHASFRGLEIAKEFKKRNKVVVMGGYMASLMPQKALEVVDSVIVGDAEISYPLMLKDYQKTGRIKKIYHHPVTDLSNLPLPRYDLLTSKPIGTMLPVQAGRGCPNSCSFCSIACIYKGRYITRPIDEVIRDIKMVKKLGFKSFYLIDDNIVSNPGYFMELCERITPLNMSWSSQCSLLIAKNPSLLRIAKKSGVTMMSFGIESITQEGLNKLNKKWLNVNEHEKLINIIAKEGIMVSSEMIFGTDSDTEQSLNDTFDFIMHSQIAIPRFYIITPIPGTKLYKNYKRSRRLLTENLKDYDGTKSVYIPENITPQKLEKLYWQINEKTFLIRNILKRTLLNRNLLTNPFSYIFAFFVNLHYRKYIKKKVPPNIF